MIDRRRALAAAAAIGASLIGARQAAAAQEKKHRVTLHVDENDEAKMNLALNNATNITELYNQKGEGVDIEIVTYGPGLHMLRADTSPVKERIKSFAESMPNVTFAACANTMAGMKKREGKDIPLLPDMHVVPAGVVHLIERQEQGWSYVKP
jgi:intracellular sulfur oxidation DsrE/DsrF family protein